MALRKAPSPFPPPSFSILLLLFFAIQTPLSFSIETISANSSISGDQQLTSKGGNFVLGFYRPVNSTKYYIAIWYKKVSQQTAVWVANRETPVSDHTTSELKLSHDGNLVLLNESKAQVWSTNATISSNSTVAVLEDSGSLVLRDGSNSSKVLWQSIDHPTHTWLPGGKLGLNKVTKENQRLIAWRSSADPAPGIFSLELDPNGTSQYFIQWNQSHMYWSSGPWNGEIFSWVPEMTANYDYDFKYINNSEESYFTYSVKSDSVISRFIMDYSGRIQQLTWIESTKEWMLFWSQPRALCDVYSLCGPFGSCNENGLPFCNCVYGFVPRNKTEWDLQDQTGGCVRRTQLQCSSDSSANVKNDKFYQMDSMRLPENGQNLNVGSAEDCASACLNNCSCNAYSFSSGCSLWYGNLTNLQEQYNGSNGGTLYLRLAASELPDSTSKKGTATGAVLGAVAGFVVCVIVAWVLIWRHRKRRMIRAARAVGRALVPFRYSDLQYFTKNFSDKLGQGGFGSVFKGFLPDSTALAVKKLEGLSQGEKQFRTEVSTIGTIQHVNLVRLLGFCSEGARRLLVYEFMPKGSLDTLLFQNTSVVLDWNTRYRIALGTARGLAYLHEKCRDCIIHCDIKPENILLDASFVPKVSDFGLAKLVGRDFSRVLTTMRGTRGYLAPEWITGVAITAKADVYSYGMMLFEIISGRRNSEQTEEGKAAFFPTLAVNRIVQGDVQSLIDHRLEDGANIEELERAGKVACWCIQDDESFRPTMGQVVQILEGNLEVNMPPIPRSLQMIAVSSENINFFSELSSNQSSQIRSTASTDSQVKSSSSTGPNV